MKLKNYIPALVLVCLVVVTASCGAKKESTKKMQNTEKEKKVKITTTYGDIVVKLYNSTPQHRDNFLKLAEQGFYSDLLFHRVINAFMIQGGDPDSKNAEPGKMLGAGDIGYTLPAEFDTTRIHKKGALAAARQGDMVNPQKRSSGCQFYIVQGQVWDASRLQMFAMQKGFQYTPEQLAAYTSIGGTPHLDRDYTVFGEVVTGLDVVDKIAAVQTLPGDRPATDIKFTISVLEE